MTATFKFRFCSCFLFQVQSRWWWHLNFTFTIFSSEYCFFKLFQALTNSTTPTDALQQILPLSPATEAQAKSRLANLVSPLKQIACRSNLTSSNALSDLNRILFVYATLLPYLWKLEFYTFLMSSFPPPALNIGEALISPQKAGSSPSSLSSQFRESLHVASEGQQSPKMTSRPHPMSPSSGFARSSSVRITCVATSLQVLIWMTIWNSQSFPCSILVFASHICSGLWPTRAIQVSSPTFFHVWQLVSFFVTQTVGTFTSWLRWMPKLPSTILLRWIPLIYTYVQTLAQFKIMHSLSCIIRNWEDWHSPLPSVFEFSWSAYRRKRHGARATLSPLQSFPSNSLYVICCMIAGRHRAAQLKLAQGPEKVTCLGTCFPIFFWQ